MTEEQFVAMIIADPSDCVAKFAFADWLGENNGDAALAFTYRWLAKRQLHPHCRLKYPPTRIGQVRCVPEKFRWAWWSDRIPAAVGPDHIPSRALLPKYVCYAVMGVAEKRVYPSFEFAIGSLASGLQKLREALE